MHMLTSWGIKHCVVRANRIGLFSPFSDESSSTDHLISLQYKASFFHLILRTDLLINTICTFGGMCLALLFFFTLHNCKMERLSRSDSAEGFGQLGDCSLSFSVNPESCKLIWSLIQQLGFPPSIDSVKAGPFDYENIINSRVFIFILAVWTSLKSFMKSNSSDAQLLHTIFPESDLIRDF